MIFRPPDMRVRWERQSFRNDAVHGNAFPNAGDEAFLAHPVANASP